MKTLIFFTLFLYPYITNTTLYHFDKVQNTIAPLVFNRYIRPQIRHMIRNYFSLIKLMGGPNKKLVRLKNLIRQSDELFAQIQKKTDNRYVTLKNALSIHYVIDNKVNLLLQSTIRPQSKFVSYGDFFVIFREKLSRFLRVNLEIIRHIEEILLISGTPYQTASGKFNDTTFRRHSLNLNFDQLVTLLLPAHFREDFQSLYINFIGPLDHYVFIGKKDDYLMANLEKFNNLWNAFHMKITKSTLTPDKKISEIVSSMHRNWNSLLKIIL